MDFNEALGNVLRYNTNDVKNLTSQMEENEEHRKPNAVLRMVAADAYEEAGDKEFADYLRSPHPVAVTERQKVLRSTLKLHRILTTLHKRHKYADNAGGSRLADPLNKEAINELLRLNRTHEANMLKSYRPTKYRDGLVRGDFPAYAWPGGANMLYITNDNNILCPTCRNGGNGSLAMEAEANDEQWGVAGMQPHEEGPPEHCAHCNVEIPSSYYEEPDAEEDDQ